MTHKIIIDTDPGIDDAMAIFFAFQAKELEVLGLTTVYGNVSADMACQNGLALVELAGLDIPVCKGVARPWVGEESTYAHFVHGNDGFGNINHPQTTRTLDSRPSAQFIVDMARKYPGEITIVAVAPLGNLALALRLEPALPSLIKEVNIMGGAAFVPGNVTPVAEANIWNDAYAAEIVFAADWKVNMFGLDVTYDIPFKPEFIDNLETANPMLGGFIARASQFYSDFYSQGKNERVCFYHDAFPIAYILQPEIFQMTPGHMRISTDNLNKGQTTFTPEKSTMSHLSQGTPVINVATKVDHAEISKLFVSTYALKN
jgi:inosine-uridine nucleoside N-ribohydrolase